MSDTFQNIAIDKIQESSFNPRKHYDQEKLKELAESIKQKGILQPLVLRSLNGTAKYELVVGSRRYRAGKLAGLESVPAIIRTYSDEEVIEIQSIENLQREDIHPLEEAGGYQKLFKLGKYTPESLAEKIGKSISYVYQRLKLNDLIPSVKKEYLAGELSFGHVRLLARMQAEDQKQALEYLFGESTWYNDHKYSSIKTLNEWIENNVNLELHAAAFPKNDADLVPAAGACTNCPKNTAYSQQLFPELAKKAICTDPKCFKQKVDAFLKKRQDEILKLPEDKQPVKVTKNYGSSTKGVYPPNQYKSVSKLKDCKNVEEAIVVEGELKELGKKIFICKNYKCRKHWERYESNYNRGDLRWQKEQKAKKKKTIFEQNYRQKLLKIVLEKINNELNPASGGKAPNKILSWLEEYLKIIALSFWKAVQYDEQLRYAKLRGWEIKSKGYSGSLDKQVESIISGLKSSELIEMMIGLSMIDETRYYEYHTPDMKNIIAFAKKFKINMKGLKTRMLKEKKIKVKSGKKS